MKPIITFDEYAKTEVMVGTIVAAVVPEGSAKLIQFSVDFGTETRTIFSGIKEWYSPDELVGVKTLWVTNIPPKKTPFGESAGMLFAVDTTEGKPHIVRVGPEVANGSTFH
jgi:methionyl-tRNA synthetase